MRRNDLFDIEDRIRNAVDSALHYIDDYSDVKNTALNEVKSHLKRSAGFAQETFDNFNKKYCKDNPRRDSYNNMNSYPVNVSYNYIASKPAGRISGVVFSVLGISGSVAFGGLTLMGLIAMLTMQAGKIQTVTKGGTIFFGMVFVLSLAMTFIGSNARKRIRRFKKYAACFSGKKYCKIELLAAAVGESNKFVLKDLEKMIKLDMFKQAYFDDDNTYLMLSNEVYENYQKSKEAFNKRKEEAAKEEEKEKENSELAMLVRTGKDYISKIRSANDAIPGEVISAKLDKLEKVVSAIFYNIEKNQNKIPDVKKFINHYLPMTLKLVNSYKELDAQIIEGENIKNAKEEIEKSIDLINTAFEKLLDDLFADMAMDVSSDISVLETLFSQEGLTDDGMRKKK